MSNQVSNIMGQSKTNGGSGAKTRDPGGFTSSMSSAGKM